MDKLFKSEEEMILKDIKAEHVHEQRYQHGKDTEQAYKSALKIYREQRAAPAKDALKKVEDLSAGYKLTDVFLQAAAKHAAEDESQRQRRQAREIKDPQMAVELAKEATALYFQAAALDGDNDTAVIRKKLSKLILTFRQMADEDYIRQQLDRIAQKADEYDQEVFKLTEAKDFAGAKKKFNEFQQEMTGDLMKLQSTVKGDSQQQ